MERYLLQYRPQNEWLDHMWFKTREEALLIRKEIMSEWEYLLPEKTFNDIRIMQFLYPADVTHNPNK